MAMTDSQKLEKLNSIDEILRLKHIYWMYNDVGFQGDKIAELFAEDGVWSNDGAWSKKQLGYYKGREAIRDFFNGLSGAVPFCAHIGMNPIIEVNGDTAVGKWRALLLGTTVNDENPRADFILIDYLDEFVRVNGVWQIKKMDILFNFNVPFGSSWAGLEVVRKD
ncbi:hypothetical protein B0E33_09890 [Roseibium algicola]|uniref:SnoaL-like domain-containing protein n=1 Tax=Roseibium algicola TaxID=2857014 RepID=A0ABN4WSE9_9HYPH|nr:nuclear transport factor 2 family protein [Roseibium aggregatum]AQQ03861.1 hypothetical protein B0E33_09890 [Roseibium aggregatum]